MEKRNEYFENMKFVLYICKALGVFPLALAENGSTTSKLFSLLSFGISVIMTAHCSKIAYSNISAIITQDFDTSILELPSLALRVFILTIPFCCWPTGRSLGIHLRNWHEFQKEFVSITGSPFHQSIRKKTVRVFCMEIIMTVIFIIVFLNTTWKSQISIDFVGSSVQLIVLYNFLFYWYINGLFTRLVLRMFSREMRKNIQSSNYHKIRRLVVLWLKLCKLVEEFVECHSYVFLVSVLGNVIFTVFCWYVSLILLPKLRGVMTTVLTGLSLLCVYFYCDVGHTLQRTMTVELQELLLMQDLTKTNPRILNELWIFSQLMEARKFAVVLNGYFTMNRVKIYSIITVCLNYVIILRQFELSADSP